MLRKQSDKNGTMISLTLDDLKNYTYFGRWILKTFGDEIKLSNLDTDDVKTAIDGIIHSEQFSAMPKEDRLAFDSAFNEIILNLAHLKDLKID